MNELRIKSQERLLAYGIRPSLPRVEVMLYLLEHRTHPNVDTIYKDLLPKIPSPHAHFLCKNCGKIYDLNFSPKANMQLDFSEHLIDEVSLYYRGICKECLAKMKK